MIITTAACPSRAGVGFAVPINVAKEILPQLRDKGKVVRGWLGVQIQPITEELAKTYRLKEPQGAAISRASPPAAPAEKAGLKAEDVIVAADGRPIKDNGDLSPLHRVQGAGSHGEAATSSATAPSKQVAVTLGTFPDETRGRRHGGSAQGPSRHDPARPHSRRWPSGWSCPGRPRAWW